MPDIDNLNTNQFQAWAQEPRVDACTGCGSQFFYQSSAEPKTGSTIVLRAGQTTRPSGWFTVGGAAVPQR
jgi:hypothetical protein